ncbi:MAG: lamin tail domain-containing protein, partial [Planctomycetota bacterium]
TEVYTGLSGPDGTADWIEITNFGNTNVNLSGLFYDDSSLDITEGGDLSSFDLGAGNSVVVLVSVAPAEAADEIFLFNLLWGSGIDVIATDGGGLSQNSDTAALLDGLGNVIDSVVYDDSFAGGLSTIEVNNGVQRASVLGENNAFASGAFVNEDFAGPGGEIQLIGSPGQIPTPGAFALVGLGGLAVARRRRA